MNRAAFVIVGVLVVFAAEGCSRSIHSISGGGSPSSSPAPAAISSSADVVKVRPAAVSIPAGGNADATVMLTISPGFHINANPATFPYLIPTEVQHSVDPDDPLVIGKPVYPIGVKKKFAFADQPLSVYEGDVTIKLPLRAVGPDQYGHATPGSHFSWAVTVKVQACDNEKCYAPATLNATIAVDVK